MWSRSDGPPLSPETLVHVHGLAARANSLYCVAMIFRVVNPDVRGAARLAGTRRGGLPGRSVPIAPRFGAGSIAFKALMGALA